MKQGFASIPTILIAVILILAVVGFYTLSKDSRDSSISEKTSTSTTPPETNDSYLPSQNENTNEEEQPTHVHPLSNFDMEYDEETYWSELAHTTVYSEEKHTYPILRLMDKDSGAIYVTIFSGTEFPDGHNGLPAFAAKGMVQADSDLRDVTINGTNYTFETGSFGEGGPKGTYHAKNNYFITDNGYAVVVYTSESTTTVANGTTNFTTPESEEKLEEILKILESLTIFSDTPVL